MEPLLISRINSVVAILHPELAAAAAAGWRHQHPQQLRGEEEQAGA